MRRYQQRNIDWSNPEQVRKYQREWAKENRNKRRESERKYRDIHREKSREKSKKDKTIYRLRHADRIQKYRENNKEKIKAQNLVNKNLDDFPLASECELCPDNDKRIENLQHHHPDYNYPEIYITTCPSCHYYADRDRMPSKS